MPVHRAHILKPHLLEDCHADQTALEPVLEPMGHVVKMLPAGQGLRQAAVIPLKLEIARPAANQLQMPRNAADIFRNRHLIVIQNNDQRLLAGPGVVHPLVKEATGHRAVAQ